ncbi:MAG: hypothetical protein ABJD07_03590 [Gemmatimonadaceae bacterium]
MRHVLAVVALAVVATACSDPVTAPPSPTSGLRAAFLIGDPPPPPLTGTGDGTFSTLSGAALSVATAVVGSSDPHQLCSVSDFNFQFAWRYFINKPENNAWIHVDELQYNGHSDFHSTEKKNDASGQIVGPDFTFSLGDVVSGSVFNETRTPGSFYFVVTGKLTLADGQTCDVTGNVTLNLNREIGEGSPR